VSGRTMSEKILSSKSGRDVRAGDLVVCDVDGMLGPDAATPMALDYFERMGGSSVRDASRIVFALDHYAPAPNAKTANYHRRMRDFAKEHGIHVYEVGDGIGHQLIVESGRALPGSLMVGADSHSVTYGAFNAFATGIGSSDFAAAMMTGQVWLKVPESIRVVLHGNLKRGVFPKDVVLHLLSHFGADGANYRALEFHGSLLSSMDMEDRLVLTNMVVEMGAKNGILEADATTMEYLRSRNRDSETLRNVAPDPDASYLDEVNVDVASIEPLVAAPHSVDNVMPLRDAVGTPVHMVFLGTCTGGRTRDYHEAHAVLSAAGGVAAGVQLVITPASREVLRTLTLDGTLRDFLDMGALVSTPGCGACCGTCGAIPADGVNVMSSANRNFKARMGNASASIYLASPASCAAAAARGVIVDPREILT